MKTKMIKSFRELRTLKDIKTLEGIKCPACNGTGIAKTRLRCLVCGGSGFLRDI
jgi:RecJ-like exonuclease